MLWLIDDAAIINLWLIMHALFFEYIEAIKHEASLFLFIFQSWKVKTRQSPFMTHSTNISFFFSLIHHMTVLLIEIAVHGGTLQVLVELIVHWLEIFEFEELGLADVREVIWWGLGERLSECGFVLGSLRGVVSVDHVFIGLIDLKSN